MNEDIITKALIYDNQVQAIAVKSTNIVNKAIKIHNLSPVCSAALGRTLTVTAMMACNLKNKDENLSVTVKGGGPIGSIITACDGALNLRGYVDNPSIMLPLKSSGKLDVSGVVGSKGKLIVIKDIGLKSPYIGQSEIVSGEIAEDFANYFAISEQQPCLVALGVLIGKDCNCISSGGLILNILPDCSEEVITKVEKCSSKLLNISDTLKDLSAKQFLNQLFTDDGIQFTEELYPKYNCKCSNERIDRVILSMGKEEAYKCLKEGELKVICNFCNTEYKYDKKMLDALFN